ncbi:MAG: aminotransferase class V-fold PLP-dependent enzyme [Phycisphaera sp.]|nr:MAG: aminotransferase class V-fold PLP-dependent enzyme [Phycisphaera sp.]
MAATSETSCNPLHQVHELAEILLDSESEQPVRPMLDPKAARRDLELDLPESGLPLERAIDKLRSVVLATPVTTGTGFYNQLFGGRESIAVLADMLAAICNTSMYTYKAAGVQVILEQILLEKMMKLAGFAGGDGLFTPGGSMSNMAAMIIARNEAVEDSREAGFPAGDFVVYTSAESHYSVRKNAGLLGIGRANVVAIPADEIGRMIPEKLDEQIVSDLAAGKKPLMTITTSGTTVMGAFDPIKPIVEVAKKHNTWVHVDGAFGGSALLSDAFAHLMDGLELADSFTWDAHKMMGVPLICSVMLTRHAGMTTKHFDEAATYLFQQDEDMLNPGTRSLQCGRRNDALKLWAAWQHLGDEGYKSRVERQFELAQHFRSRIDEDLELQLSCDPQWITVCFEVTGKPSDQICDELDRRQMAKIGWGIVHGRRVIRMVCVNPDLTTSDLDDLLAKIKAVGAEMPEADNAVTK